MIVHPYEKNAKKHSDKQVKQIADSIIRFGWQQPIVVDKDRNIIVGHGRYLAWQKYGQDMFEPWITDNEGNTLSGRQGRKLTAKEVKAYRLADNKLNQSDWEMDLVLEELAEIGDLASLTGFSELTEKESNSITLKDTYEIVVECKDEAEQEEIYQKLTDQGYTCRVLTL